MTKLTGRGGAGRGQGAKKQVPVGASRHNLLMTDEEYASVREFIKKLRSVSK